MAKKQIATFLAPNKGLSIVGNHAYGYSGVLDIGADETDMLSFTTGNYYFVGTLQFNYLERQGETFQYKFYLNNLVVQGFIEAGGSTGEPNAPTTFMNVIIPPNTLVKATAQNILDAATRDQVCNMAGRIYNA
jgi:hypothetical protein|tara:strand:+ start:65 stop:463 length:399 start_codon:yes stop_codon:yes gene_type:complete